MLEEVEVGSGFGTQYQSPSHLQEYHQHQTAYIRHWCKNRSNAPF